MFCPHCAKEIPDDAVVCMGCGRAVQPLRQTISQPVVQSGWSLKTVAFLLYGSAILPPIGWIAGIVGLFKAETRTEALNILVFSIFVAGSWATLTPIVGIFVGLVCATIGVVSGQRKAKRVGAGTIAQAPTAGAPSSTAPSATKACPKCAETIPLEALICRFCGNQFSEAEVATARQDAQEKASQAQLEASEKRRQTRNTILAIVGGLLALSGACLTIMMIFYAFSKEAADASRTGGVISIMWPFFCSLPLLALGIGLTYLGIRGRRARSAPEIPYVSQGQ